MPPQMICPKCKATYRAGFTRCADCDVDLIEDSPRNSPKKKNKGTGKRTLNQDLALGFRVLVFLLTPFILLGALSVYALRWGNSIQGAYTLGQLSFMFLRRSFITTIAGSVAVGGLAHLMVR